MKRFVETDDWRDQTFRQLSPQAKHLRRYLWDHCDCVGVIPTPDFGLVSFHVGEPINEKHLAELHGWLHQLKPGLYWIRDYIRVQYKRLKPSSPVHARIIENLAFHNLTVADANTGSTLELPLGEGYTTLQEEDQVQEEEEDQDQIRKGESERKTTPDRIQRLNRLFRRRDTTPWSLKERRAYRASAELCPLDEFELIEAYYQSGSQYLRRDLQTLLNNWNGEVDRARQWRFKPNGSNAPQPPVLKIKRLN